MADEEFELRFLTADDAIAYSKLRLEALERDKEAFGSSAEEHGNLSLNDIRARLAADVNKFVIGAFIGNQLVGTAGFFREKGLKERHKGRIWGVYLAHEARGKGTGRKMLQAVLQHASQIEGIEQIMISVTTTQEVAANLYRSLGFESFGREPRALKIENRYIDEEHMILFVDHAAVANS